MSEGKKLRTVLVLTVVSKAHKGKEFEIDPKGASLGRKGLSLMHYKELGQIRFPEDEVKVSHKHATIAKTGPGPQEYAVKDNGSLNGTWLDGDRLSDEREESEFKPLNPGSVLNVGTYDLQASFREVAAKNRPPKKLADRRSAGVQKWRRWFNDTTAHLDKGGSAKDLPCRPGTIPKKQIKLSELRDDQVELPTAWRDSNSLAARAREELGLSTDRKDAPARAKSSVYDRLMPNTAILTKVVASTVMHNKIREEEDWEKEVYGQRGEAKHTAPRAYESGGIGLEDMLMDQAIAGTRQQIEHELAAKKRPAADEPADPSKRARLDQMPPPPPPVPAEWQQHVAPTGHVYWYNTVTGVSQWQPPPNA